MLSKRKEKRLISVKRAVAALLLTSILPTTAFAVKGEVECKRLILRKGPSQTSRALQSLQRGDTFEILSADGEWYKVKYGKYTGYVMKEYVEANGKVDEIAAVKQPAATEAEAKSNSSAGMEGIKSIVDIGDAPATSRKGDSGTKVKKLQQALKLKGYYTGTIDGKYGTGTENAVKAFQKAHGMARDGIAGKVTIKILFGEEAADKKTSAKTEEKETKTYETLKLSWFNGGSSAVPKGATFTVKDVKTGKTFTCRRWSGVNHMDVEPLTAKDAAVMKSIYGGSWSWNRRAILVKYGDKVYAASMNGMPHGSQTITGNDFDGHFCIHFYKSKTHGTKKVDTGHQNAVNTASKYTW